MSFCSFPLLSMDFGLWRSISGSPDQRGGKQLAWTPVWWPALFPGRPWGHGAMGPWGHGWSRPPIGSQRCCYIWCSMDPIIFYPSHVSIFLPAPWIMGYVAIWRESRIFILCFRNNVPVQILSRRHVMVGNTLVGTKILQTLRQDVAGRHCRVANDRSSPAASWWTWFSTRNRVVITPVCLFVCVCVSYLAVDWGLGFVAIWQ